MKTIKENKEIFIGVLVIIIILAVVFILVKKGNGKNLTENNQIVDEIINDENNEEIKDVEKIQDDSIIKKDGVDFKKFNKEEYDRIMSLGADAYNNQRYVEAINYYKKALAMEELDVIYGKMYSVYNSMKDYTNAGIVLEKALKLNPTFNQYWIWKIEREISLNNADYSVLEKIYKEGIDKVELTAKVNLVLFFARVSEQEGEKAKAIELWKQAIELYPDKTSIYQAEITRLSNSL